MTALQGGFGRTDSLLHGEITVPGHALFPSKIPAPTKLPVKESEQSPKQWGWLGKCCDFYSTKFDRLPRVTLFVFLRKTFYRTQKYFANENKKATYRRLCEPPHRQMLLSTVLKLGLETQTLNTKRQHNLLIAMNQNDVKGGTRALLLYL